MACMNKRKWLGKDSLHGNFWVGSWVVLFVCFFGRVLADDMNGPFIQPCLYRGIVLTDYSPVNERSHWEITIFFLEDTIKIGGFSSQLSWFTRGYPVQFGFVDPKLYLKKTSE